MEKSAGAFNISASTLEGIKNEIKSIPDFNKEIGNASALNVTEILEIIFGAAITLGSSDVHIEPEESQARLRVRIDGILQDVSFLDKKIYESLLSRIKLLSGLKLNISDRPQDGRFSIVIDGQNIEIRTSTLPAERGESIVLRVLNPKNLIEVEALGMRADLFEIFKREIKKPNGMIIVTGPTGSGKTTTLYAVLSRLQKPEIKIITIEDPVEYHLKGISQTQADPKKGYDFASGLKSMMRQDPNVILVGEIRDLETAQIAIQAALTGHLVLTTIHTNDAAGTIARLTSLGANPADVAPALNIIIAQRLVRKACKECSEIKKPSPEDLKKLKEGLEGVPKEILPISLAKENDIQIPYVKGCKLCNFTGYSGRIGIYEILSATPDVQNFIIKNPSITDLREFSTKKGMTTMRQDGLIKVLNKVTTIEEVERVSGEK